VNKILILFFIIFLFFDTFGIFGICKAEAATLKYERLFYYVEGKNARKSFFANAKSIDIFAPQNYMVDKDGLLFGSVKPDLLTFAKKNKIKVMPLLTNGNFSTTTCDKFLNSITAQEMLINSLILEAKDFGYIGWQIDFEQMNLSYRDKFSEFIERTYAMFQKS